MQPSKCRPLLQSLLLLVLLSAGALADAPDFIRDVRPILSSHCFKCHGPDDATREGGLRLDVRGEALKAGESGDVAIAPGKPEASALIARIFTDDSDELMPPANIKHPLSVSQKEVLKRWVAAGAEYRPHWSFVAPKQVVPPAGSIQAIDAFILKKLAEVGLPPSPEAERLTLLRRVCLDLTGLPPTEEQVAAFENDTQPGAYERAVDSLLDSPRYGERWARRWLDLARYADTNGYEKDRDRSIWPYRDWVIRALNDDMPFDQFTIEQIAGDMLPDATFEQLVATGFHRNTMLNEEGGIDPLEFRFHAVVDRVGTTGTAWLGLTVACAQCHTHKYDPILHTDYYRLMALLNNADEPELEIPAADAAERTIADTERAAKLIAELADQWPLPTPLTADWYTPKPTVSVSEKEDIQVLDDSSVQFAAPGPERQTITFTLQTTGLVDRIRLDAIAAPNVGRVSHGNFVVSELMVTVLDAAGKTTPVKLSHADATFQQKDFPVAHAYDGNPATGWAVDDQKMPLNKDHSATFYFAEPMRDAVKLQITLLQNYGSYHTLMRPKISVGSPALIVKQSTREEIVSAEFSKWLSTERARNVAWTTLRPATATANLPLLTIENDDSIFASGDFTKQDTYELVFRDIPAGTQSLRLEAMEDERLPARGPGMTYYEGPKGDFFLTEFRVEADGEAVKIGDASHSHAKNHFGAGPATAMTAIDGDMQTGWSCSDRPGETHEAVFVFEKPLVATKELRVKLHFGRHYACSLGRFRISASDAKDVVAGTISAQIRTLLAVPESRLAATQLDALRSYFLITAPELAEAAKTIRSLLKSQPASTSLVMRERPDENPRPTFLHKRGEFLQPADPMQPAVPHFLPQLPAGQMADRLALAKWLVSSENPLTARVVVNREWAAFFGTGIVATLNDFGLQGEAPTHPELLDWLAVEFVKNGWSLKKLHRLIATSATYRQSSRVTVEQLARDPRNRLLARGPRVRLEAEVIRDSTLAAAGTLSTKMFGPPVHPPQPAGVTEAAYGGQSWQVSEGEDRYRRSIYTLLKRTAPFAMFNTFDAPSGEACVARRDVSNTPLQSLTLLNDEAFLEAAQKLGALVVAAPGGDAEKASLLFRRVITRPPTNGETKKLLTFLDIQRNRIAVGQLDADTLAGKAEGDAKARAAWTAVARVVLNLDEAITKN